MYIVNSETPPRVSGVLDFIPRVIRRRMYGVSLDGADEIRMRLGMPVAVHYPDGFRYVGAKGNLTSFPASDLRVERSHIDEALELATGSSVYSSCDEIKNGFITVRGGHRIGITGTAVVKDGEVTFIKDISSLNYRLAAEVKGAADSVMPLIEKDGMVRSSLIISPPGAGKTTMLRDIARQLSYKAYRVSVVDERREIAAVYEGKSSFDLGANTDILEGCDKAAGMLMVLRSMSPEVIVTDELGEAKDIAAVSRAANSGTAVIASVHGRDIASVKRRSDLSEMLRFFDVIITLSRRNGAGTVEEAITQW